MIFLHIDKETEHYHDENKLSCGGEEEKITITHKSVASCKSSKYDNENNCEKGFSEEGYFKSEYNAESKFMALAFKLPV